MEEEYKILENSVKDFNAKYVDNVVLKIEKEGIPESIRKAMVEQGFTAMVQALDGNKVVDRKALSILIETLASSSPSVAMDVFITNALFLKLAPPEQMDEVSQGMKTGTVAFAELMSNYENDNELQVKNGKLYGSKKYVLKPDSDYIIASTREGSLVLAKSGFKVIGEHRRLGFRGLRFGTVEFDTDDFVEIGKKDMLVKVYNESSPFITAMALGISNGAISKAIEYSKVRTAFGSPLKDFQPIAFLLSEEFNELSLLRNSLYETLSGEYNESGIIYLKIKSLDLAKEITKNSIQVHGGYGYIEDYAVEKFYRDIMALSVLLFNEENEKKELAKLLYEGEAGII